MTRHPRRGQIVWHSDASGEALSLAPSGFVIVRQDAGCYRLYLDRRFVCQRGTARDAKREAEEMLSDMQIAGVAS